MLSQSGRCRRSPRVAVTQSTILRSPVLRGEQARVVERDAGVEDADRDAAAVPRGMGGDELCAAGVADRHVRVVVRRAKRSAGSAASGPLAPCGRRVAESG